jgi:hypothetical protein
MATRFTSRSSAYPPGDQPDARALSRRMTWHVAAAMIVYAALQLWLVIGAVAGGGSRVLPYVAVGLVLVAAVPLARMIEQRWARLARTAPPSRQLSRRYRLEALRLWVAAIVLPFVWVGAFVGAGAAAHVIY